MAAKVNFRAELSRFRHNSTTAVADVRAILDGGPIPSDDLELDGVERVAAAIISSVRQELLRREGGKVRRWGPRGPGVQRLKYNAYYLSGKWCDHCVRITLGAQEMYMSQPYSLNKDALRELLDLADREGWDVTIGGWPSVHFPSRTMAVVLRKATTAQ